MRLLHLLLPLFLSVGCPRPVGTLALREFGGDVFGSYYLIRYRSDVPAETLRHTVERFFDAFNREFSTYQRDSLISRFNQLPAGVKLPVSPRFIAMLELAEKLHRETGGAFDPTLGPVIKLWGFGGGTRRAPPTDRELRAAMAKVGLARVRWDRGRNVVWKQLAGVELDVNAFAPGWAADLLGEVFEEKGIRNYMIDVSGDILFRGLRSSDEAWVAGVEKPSELRTRGVQLAFRISDLAVSTSGNYRQYYRENGKHRSHIIDPRTGRPVTHNISSASVIAASGAAADAWSTALMVLGEAGIPLSEKSGVRVLLLAHRAPDQFTEVNSLHMREYIKVNKL